MPRFPQMSNSHPDVFDGEVSIGLRRLADGYRRTELAFKAQHVKPGFAAQLPDKGTATVGFGVLRYRNE
ncbi:MAG: hypothetical protein NVS4B6_07670 [Mycobacterium sp.]